MTTVYVMNIHVCVLVNQITYTKSNLINYKAPLLAIRLYKIHHSPIPYYNLYQ